MLASILSLVGVLVGFWLGRKFSGGEEAAFSARFEESTREREKIRQERDAALQRAEELNRKVGELESLRDLDALREKISKEIELAAGKALEKNALQFQERAEKGVGFVLNPLKEKIQDFEKKIEERYVSQTKDVHALKEEIKRIVDSNERISKEADALSKALRGEQKTQGDWGEMQVETLLEASGLIQGQDYLAQGEIKDEFGHSQRPDYLINLPGNKKIILDSKVSLSSWLDYCQAKEQNEQEKALQKTLDSIYHHVDDLAGKHYQKNEKLKTLEFVLMFVSPEGALLAASKKDSKLFKYAWEKNVVIVGPTTAFPALRLFAQIWRGERQTKNAVDIAQNAGALYDEFVFILEALQELEKSLNKAQEKREEIVKRISHGRGNVLKRIESLKKLGAKANKQISGELLDSSDGEDSAFLTVSPPRSDS